MNRFLAVALAALLIGALAFSRARDARAGAIVNVPLDYPSISAALISVSDGDTILVAPGTYEESLQFGGKNVTLKSTDGAAVTVIDSFFGTAIDVGPGGVVDGFTITGGGAYFGAGMKVHGLGTFITNNVFNSNVQYTGGRGAGIDGDNASPHIEGNVFTGNFCDNQWTAGVLSFVNNSSPYIGNNLLINNTCRAINMTLPTGNHPIVVNNTIVGNPTGVREYRAVSTYEHTYRNNIIAFNGIGLEVDFGNDSMNPRWENNLVFGNGIDYETTTSLTGQFGNIGEDPGFRDSANGDFHILPGSPAIDAGNADTVGLPSFDVDGDPRLLDGNADSSAVVDIGADEYDNDQDGDGVLNANDNCPDHPNPGQEDFDADGAGDVCDVCPSVSDPAQIDSDSDGPGNACDNCPQTANSGQEDGDADKSGDVCDVCPTIVDPTQADSDSDGVGDACDNCPQTANSGQEDLDGDNAGDVCDACPTISDPTQADSDSDGVGDACDNCPDSANQGQENAVHPATTLGDHCDDPEQDGVTDISDNCPDTANADQSEGDGDAVGDTCDNCPTTANADQIDTDGDTSGDACDGPGSGNVDCTSPPIGVSAVDALKVLRFIAGLPVLQNEPCADIGASIAAGLQGDVDCSGEVNAVDALFILRTVAGLSVNIPQGCPAIKQ